MAVGTETAAWLQPQEDLFAVKKIAEQDPQAQSGQRCDQVTEAGRDCQVEKASDVASGEAETEPVKVDDVIGQVNRDRVHADPHEWLAPFLAFPDINHEIEKSEQQGAVAA